MKLADFDLEQRVKITASKGRILIEPTEPMETPLADLLAAITPENLHDAVDFGEPVGREAL
jgi:antitoxin MazE